MSGPEWAALAILAAAFAAVWLAGRLREARATLRLLLAERGPAADVVCDHRHVAALLDDVYRDDLGALIDATREAVVEEIHDEVASEDQVDAVIAWCLADAGREGQR